MNGQQIINNSTIGQISDATKFLDGHTMAEFKSMLVSLTDKAITMLPSAIKQAGKEDAKLALDEMFRKAVRQSWKTSTDYYCQMQNGNTGLTVISRDQIGDIVRMLCNMIDQS